MHQHSRDVRGEMRAAAQAGVTTVIELGTYPDDLITHLRAEKGVCDLLSAGSAASAPRLGEHADQAFSHSVESVRRMHTAGVRIVAGTDANATPGSPSPVAHGSSLHDEIDLLHEAGLTNTESLAAATSSAAAALQLTDRGHVAVGQRADLLLANGDPAEDPTTARFPSAVWVAGQKVL